MVTTTDDADAAMERYAEGDAHAFEVVVRVVGPRVAQFAHHRLRDPHAVEDVVQETLIRMHAARGDFAPGAAVMPWAYTIARRVIIDLRRRRLRERDLLERARPSLVPAALAAPDAQLLADQTLLALHATMAGLSPPQREAYLLVRGHGLSLAQAAHALHTTITAVKLRMHRAASRLRHVFDRRDDP